MKEFIERYKAVVVVLLVLVGITGAVFAADQAGLLDSTQHDKMQKQGDTMMEKEDSNDAMNSESMESDSVKNEEDSMMKHDSDKMMEK